MNKTRFQLPPRTDAADGFDRWVAAEAAATASRRAVASMALAADRPSDPWPSIQFPFMFDMAALLAAQRRNMEAVTAASRAVREGVEAVARRNLQIMQQAFEGVSQRSQPMDNSVCPGDRAMRQVETAIKACEDAAANVRDMSEMIQHANSEAIEVLGKRFTEVADEMKSLARYATSRFWDVETRPAPFWQPS